MAWPEWWWFLKSPSTSTTDAGRSNASIESDIRQARDILDETLQRNRTVLSNGTGVLTGKESDRINTDLVRARNSLDQILQQSSTSVQPVSSSSTTTTRTSTNPLFNLWEPQVFVPTLALTAAAITLLSFYKRHLKRIPEATQIPTAYLRQKSIFGKVTSVGDGDNFRIFHTPGGIWGGWGWLPGRKVPTDRKELKGQTIHVRLAGIDAPELAHFGRPAQPFSQDALGWLTSYVLGRRVRAYVYKQDQYSRVVATVYVRKGLFRRDVGLQMLHAGLATVYEAKSGAEFGEGLETKYHEAEMRAKSKKKGMWAAGLNDYESPREYKTRFSNGNSPPP